MALKVDDPFVLEVSLCHLIPAAFCSCTFDHFFFKYPFSKLCFRNYSRV